MGRFGPSRMQAVCVQVGGSIPRAQVSPCRQRQRMANFRWTVPILPDFVKGIPQLNFEPGGIVGPKTAGPAAPGAAFAGGRKCEQQASMALDCSVCSLSSLTNMSQTVFLFSTSCVLSPVSSTVAALWEGEDTRRSSWNRAPVVQ
jgi:hypothetical protein